MLTEDIRFLDSAGYLCHMGFECLMKGISLFENGSFEKTHNLIDLHNTVQMKLDKGSIKFLKVINSYEYCIR
jgi:hypothetical protein